MLHHPKGFCPCHGPCPVLWVLDVTGHWMSFHTCQVRVITLCYNLSKLSSSSSPLLLDCRTSTASARSQWATNTQPRTHNHSHKHNQSQHTTKAHNHKHRSHKHNYKHTTTAHNHNTQPQHTTTAYNHNTLPRHSNTKHNQKHTSTTVQVPCRWSQGITFGCHLETLATLQRELPNTNVTTPSKREGPTSKIENHKSSRPW